MSNKIDSTAEQAIASLNIEGMRVPDSEKEILRKIAAGELNADEVVDAIVEDKTRKSLEKLINNSID
ncbi:MAG: antitoxin VbhA family protein [Cellvibrionaceae bacterium]